MGGKGFICTTFVLQMKVTVVDRQVDRIQHLSMYSARVGHPFFLKERNVLAFFSVLYRKTERFLRSFPFFIKEWNDLCVLSVLYKRMERFLRSFSFFIKERNVLCVLFRSL